MASDIAKIIKSSGKAEFMEAVEEALVSADKVVAVLIQDKEDGVYTSQVLTLGFNYSYERLGALDMAKMDLIKEEC